MVLAVVPPYQEETCIAAAAVVLLCLAVYCKEWFFLALALMSVARSGMWCLLSSLLIRRTPVSPLLLLLCLEVCVARSGF